MHNTCTVQMHRNLKQHGSHIMQYTTAKVAKNCNNLVHMTEHVLNFSIHYK
jgi:hypothetical protein